MEKTKRGLDWPILFKKKLQSSAGYKLESYKVNTLNTALLCNSNVVMQTRRLGRLV